MQTKHYLTLSDAEFLLDHTHQYAIQNSFNVSIAVVDETGNLLAMGVSGVKSFEDAEIAQVAIKKFLAQQS